MDKQIITKNAGIKIKDGSPLLQEMGVVYYLLYVGLVVDNLDLPDFLWLFYYASCSRLF